MRDLPVDRSRKRRGAIAFVGGRAGLGDDRRSREPGDLGFDLLPRPLDPLYLLLEVARVGERVTVPLLELSVVAAQAVQPGLERSELSGPVTEDHATA